MIASKISKRVINLIHSLNGEISTGGKLYWSSADWSNDWNTLHPNPTPEDLVEFWRLDRLRNIIPPSPQFSAGFDEVGFLKQLFYLLGADSVVEIGCGYGRLAPAFPAEKYLGIDINAEAVETARQKYPSYEFKMVDFDTVYPQADLYVAYTVLLHIDDENVRRMACRLTDACRRLLIVEVLEPRFRNLPSAVPNFVRSRAQYETIFSRFKLACEIRKPYAHYPGTDISCLVLNKT